MKRLAQNPFTVSGYHGPEYFCDREQEIKTLGNAIRGNRNITLISLRRVGKTALIHHLFNEFSSQKKWIFLYADLMPTTSVSDFAARITTALAHAYPDTTTLGKKVWTWIKNIRPQISFDPYTGLPQISFNLDRPHEQHTTLHQLFGFLEDSGKKTILALDEFQQITQYPEQQTEAWLRSEIQNLKSVNFIFCGSQQQLLGEMFNSVKRPFYASTQMLTLSFLEKDAYHRFISRHMTKASRLITKDNIDYILDWSRLHTYYVQALCNRLFITEEKKITRESIHAQIEMIFKEQEAVFFTYRELLTNPQWSLLRAIAKEGKLYTPTAKTFIRTYDLGTPATVKRSLDSLLQKEMIYRQFDSDGRSFYQVYDVFLSRWLEYKQ
jgi:AAA+ ATPase superfamily predicted ATPase